MVKTVFFCNWDRTEASWKQVFLSLTLKRLLLVWFVGFILTLWLHLNYPVAHRVILEKAGKAWKGDGLSTSYLHDWKFSQNDHNWGGALMSYRRVASATILFQQNRANNLRFSLLVKQLNPCEGDCTCLIPVLRLRCLQLEAVSSSFSPLAEWKLCIYGAGVQDNFSMSAYVLLEMSPDARKILQFNFLFFDLMITIDQEKAELSKILERCALCAQFWPGSRWCTCWVEPCGL